MLPLNQNMIITWGGKNLNLKKKLFLQELQWCLSQCFDTCRHSQLVAVLCFYTFTVGYTGAENQLAQNSGRRVGRRRQGGGR